MWGRPGGGKSPPRACGAEAEAKGKRQKMAMWQLAWEPLLASLLVMLTGWQGVPG